MRVWYPRKPVYALLEMTILEFCHFQVMELTEHPCHISDIAHKRIEHPPSVDHDNKKFRSKSTRYGAQLKYWTDCSDRLVEKRDNFFYKQRLSPKSQK